MRVTVDELLAEINNGEHYLATPDTRIRLNKIINLMASKVIEKKLMAPNKPKRTRAVAQQMTLEQWEQQKGAQLSIGMMPRWIAQKGFCNKMLSQMVEEFRTEMFAKGLRYADFVATFQTYLNKGYLSQSRDQMLVPKERNVTL